MIHLSNLRLGGGRERGVRVRVFRIVSYPLLRTFLRTPPLHLPPLSPHSSAERGSQGSGTVTTSMPMPVPVLVCIRQRNPQIMCAKSAVETFSLGVVPGVRVPIAREALRFYQLYQL
jgi:hypothetical protein